MRPSRLVIPGVALVGVVAGVILLPRLDPLPAAAETTDTTAATSPTPGFDEDVLRLGVIAVTSGEAADAGFAVLAGHEAYWERAGDLGGYRVELKVENGALDEQAAALAYERLGRDIALVSSSLGTSLVARAAAADILPVVADSAARSWSAWPSVVLPAGHALPGDEVAAGLDWAFSVPGLGLPPTTPVLMISTDPGLEEECLNGLRAAVGALGLPSTAVYRQDAGNLDYSEVVASLQNAGAGVVVICGGPTALGGFLIDAATVGYAPTVLAIGEAFSTDLASVLGGAPGDPESEARGLGLLAGVYVTTGMPPWEDEAPGVAAMRSAAALSGASAANLDENFYLGYTQAATAHALLTAVLEAADLSRAGVLAVLDEGVELDLGMGHGPAVVGLASSGHIARVPVRVCQPVPATERRFGLEPLTDFFVAPFLATGQS